MTIDNDSQMLHYCSKRQSIWSIQRWCLVLFAASLLALAAIPIVLWFLSGRPQVADWSAVAAKDGLILAITVNVIIWLCVHWRGDPLCVYLLKKMAEEGTEPPDER